MYKSSLKIFISCAIILFLGIPKTSAKEFSKPTQKQNRNIFVSPGQSIQKAIDKAANGDTITVNDGIYHEIININKSIVLRAANGGEAIITNRYAGIQKWTETPAGSQDWVMNKVDWPVHWMLAEGKHAFDFRSKAGFDNQKCGPYWSKGWQETPFIYHNPPIYFACDTATDKLWLHLNDKRNPNNLNIDINSANLNDTTLVQKDLGTYWNQQQIVTICKEPPVHPVSLWYGGTPEKPDKERTIDFPKICGIVIDVNADNVSIEGFRIHLAPTVGIEVNNSKSVTIKECYFSGYQFAINTGYECTNLTVKNCEMDGGELVSYGNHVNITMHMWNHNTYIIPVKFNGTGLIFHNNYVYEGFDLFQPRGRHKNYPHVPDLKSDVAYNIWQQAMDNNLEFDGVEATISMRFHHNLVLGRGSNDMLAFTTTENGNPLMVDHNIFWNGGLDSRNMKLIGTGRTNNGVFFVHNTYFTGQNCSFAPFGPDCAFDNNIIISGFSKIPCWDANIMNSFFPSKYNLYQNGTYFMIDFKGITGDPKLGQTPETRFCLQPESPAIDAGLYKNGYYNDNYTGKSPDLGALESAEDINAWKAMFGHCGPHWINSSNAPKKAPHRPVWPSDLSKKWGGL